MFGLFALHPEREQASEITEIIAKIKEALLSARPFIISYPRCSAPGL